MSVVVVGLNHRTAPVRLLERASVPSPELGGVLAELISGAHVAEAVVLSTCNRVEVYAAVNTFHGALHEIGQVLSARTGVHIAELADHLYVHYADAAVRHLFTVVSGLDSLVVGEPQILGQMREAYNAADGHGAPGRMLHEVMQQALRVGKRVHTDTDIDHAGQSVVTAALRLGSERVGSLSGRRALVVGAGSLGALAAATLRRDGIGDITVLNRTPETAHRVAAGVGGRGGDLTEIRAALAEADVVVTATGATEAVLTYQDVSAALEARGPNAADLAILDLAVPRDTERAVDMLPGVVVLDIEALTAALAHEPATTSVDAAASIVENEVEAFAAWQRSTEVAPTVVALRARADQVVAGELDRLHSRLPDLDDAARREVEKTVRRVVSTLLHTPTVRMKELATAPGGDRYAAAVRELFLLDGHARPAAAVTVEPVGSESVVDGNPWIVSESEVSG
ncbi:glutamyl-tRNA reductase [Cryptosporangium aurantiacum]|uniref:Glutamyl-tRNA reductase n=1 Tax=Cryptosporangium aurantiacum TaxID=134849 RepID=A0A1M7RH93_9ACTN|nr:glutamyl-tRNA reductase [Cryptosporangium aurantiacum]SHN45624.1 glutamyl-tRNA reductase [Cryptosporangium aurantiacum]